jgi:cytochrome c peroxidase
MKAARPVGLTMPRSIAAVVLVMAGVLGPMGYLHAGESDVNTLTFANPRGVHRTLTTAGVIDQTNPFFQDLGTNGRTCFSCHRPAAAWSVTPEELRERFQQTDGLDPIFRNNDGSNCEGADIGNAHQRRRAFSLLLEKGLIRVGLPVPSGAEFEIVDVEDPYYCGRPFSEASTYRRPLPTANLAFLSTVMWDGRETVQGRAMVADLMTQAQSATTGHAQGNAPTAEQLQQIVDFEMTLFTAQMIDRRAGSLAAGGAKGGPTKLSQQPFCIGVNDPLGILPVMPGACATASTGLDPVVFTLFKQWDSSPMGARQAIARGETLFNTKTFVIDNVAGLNGGPGDPVSGPIQGGTCTICHNTPGAGDHSIAMPLNIGLADASRRTPDLPLYTLQNKTTQETMQTTDPGRALVTGKWADVGKFKGPVLRALAARAPYFHNGSAADLEQVVDFYDTRFKIGFTDRDKADLVAFLGAL